jgi:hypothetical protein
MFGVALLLHTPTLRAPSRKGSGAAATGPPHDRLADAQGGGRRGLTACPDRTRSTTRKECGVAKEINCPCGQTVTGETDDQLVANTEEHMRAKHPEMVGTKSREEILAMAHEA